MSRVGKKPITLPKGVEVKVDAAGVHVKGPKGTVSTPILDGISVAVKDGRVDLVRSSEEKRTRAFHGLNRALVANAVDDAAQKITHVVRGEDLINVTPKVLLLREALGVGGELIFAHLPLIVNEKLEYQPPLESDGDEGGGPEE